MVVVILPISITEKMNEKKYLKKWNKLKMLHVTDSTTENEWTKILIKMDIIVMHKNIDGNCTNKIDKFFIIKECQFFYCFGCWLFIFHIWINVSFAKIHHKYNKNIYI